MSQYEAQEAAFVAIDKTQMFNLSTAGFLLLIGLCTLDLVILSALNTFECPIMRALLFLLIQLLAGIIIIRVMHIIGRSARSKLTLLDPSSLVQQWEQRKLDVNSAAISHFFEKIQIGIKSNEKSTDDLTDLSLFVIIVWSIVSSTFLFPYYHSRFLLSIAILIVLLVGIIMYTNGYRSSLAIDFQDELAKLEYFIISRVSEMERLFKARASIICLGRGDQHVLYDVMVLIPSTGPFTIHYFCGVPSKEPERILLRLESKQTEYHNMLKQVLTTMHDLLPTWKESITEYEWGYEYLLANTISLVRYVPNITPIREGLISGEVRNQLIEAISRLTECCSAIE